MAAFFNISAVQVLLLPFIGMVLLTGLLRVIGRNGSGILTANAAAGISFAWFCAFILGTPIFPPAFNNSAILSATVCLLVIGTILDLILTDKTKFGRLIETLALILCGIAVSIWMRAGADFWTMPILFGWGAVAFGLHRVGTHKDLGAGDSTLLLTIASFGLGIIAWISGIAIDRDLGFGLGAISLGFLAWNWPKPRLFFGSSILLAGGGGLYMIALRLVEQAPPLIPSLILLGFVFFTDTAVRYFPQNSKLARLLPLSLKLLTLALIPLTLSILAAVIAIEFPMN
jgi:hypothetical protein